MIVLRSKSGTFVCILFLLLMSTGPVFAQSTFATPPTEAVTGQEPLQIPFVDLSVRAPNSGAETALSLQLLLLLSVISLAPAILLLLTSFLRISIVLAFIQQALGLQQTPPRQVLLGLSVFITLFIMWPVVSEINTQAIQPMTRGEYSLEEAYPHFINPLRQFMFRQMQNSPENIRLFMRLSNVSAPQTLADIPTYVLIPSFVLNELTIAFKMGVLIFIPFIIIDIVVASITMSMGMIMLPPIIISLPLKLALFVLADGWSLLTQQLILSFGGSR